MVPLKLPKNEPDDDRKFDGEGIHMLQFPEAVFDDMPDEIAYEFQLPGLLESMPGEFRIVQDKIIFKGYFPTQVYDRFPTLPGSELDLPKLPEVSDIDPDLLILDIVEFPPMPIERVRILRRPKTIDNKLKLGKPPSPLRPKSV